MICRTLTQLQTKYRSALFLHCTRTPFQPFLVEDSDQPAFTALVKPCGLDSQQTHTNQPPNYTATSKAWFRFPGNWRKRISAQSLLDCSYLSKAPLAVEEKGWGRGLVYLPGGFDALSHVPPTYVAIEHLFFSGARGIRGKKGGEFRDRFMWSLLVCREIFESS
jgi:hypothetical protein